MAKVKRTRRGAAVVHGRTGKTLRRFSGNGALKRARRAAREIKRRNS